MRISNLLQVEDGVPVLVVYESRASRQSRQCLLDNDTGGEFLNLLLIVLFDLVQFVCYRW